jgi:flagellar biosynthetic protein FlhB
VDALAIRIKLEATRHDIPQIENRALARALYQGSREGQVIPEDLYAAVAKVLAIVWKRRRPPSRPLGQAAPVRYSPNSG